MNRPQFFFPTPKGYRDESFVRPVISNQDPSGGLPPLQYKNDYAVLMDADAPQIIRSLFWQGVQQGQNPLPGANVHIQLRNAYGVYLTDGYIPLWLMFYGAGSTFPDGGSGRAKVFESEMYCPPGSVLLIDFFNPSPTTTFQYPGLMEFRGIKRFPDRCPQ